MAILKIAIAKGGKGAIFEVDTDVLNSEDFPADAYQRIIEEGLKSLLNSRMSKLAAPTKLEGDAFEQNKAAALAKAAENFDLLCKGELVKRAASAKSAAPREVMTEARRIAKEVVKTEIRKSGMKPSLVPAADITAAANALIESDPQYIRTAEANLAERATVTSKIDIASLISESPKLKAKAEKAAADKKAQLSAKQASMPKSGKAKATVKVLPRKGPAQKQDFDTPDFG